MSAPKSKIPWHLVGSEAMRKQNEPHIHAIDEVRGRAAALRLIKHMVTTGAHKDALKLLLKVLEKAGAPAFVTAALEATLAFHTPAAQVRARALDAD